MELAAKFSSPTSVHQSSTNDKDSLAFEKLITSFREDNLSGWEEKDIWRMVRNKKFETEQSESETEKSETKTSGTKKSRAKKSRAKKFGATTVTTIVKEILSVRSRDTSETSYYIDLVNEAGSNGYNKMNDAIDDTICWEALLHSSFDDIAKCLKARGEQFKITFWILVFFYKKN